MNYDLAAYENPRYLRGDAAISDPHWWKPTTLASAAMGGGRFGPLSHAVVYRHKSAPLDRIGGPWWARGHGSFASALDEAREYAALCAEVRIYKWDDTTKHAIEIDGHGNIIERDSDVEIVW